ncbi:hrg [Cordylochernes scorpioides]|uniref:Poly(A) polymerase n=1 Tax=Cordylochernes scorpioides TaxID=51811 RepID=A0ABY6LRE7_9ARAC|nr:hrg [Cordylochernes scorpioides]
MEYRSQRKNVWYPVISNAVLYNGVLPNSLNEPKLNHFELTIELERVLETYGLYETKEELAHRKQVLWKISRLAREWVVKMSFEKNIPPSRAALENCKLYTFGSYRLGVHTKDADIDALLVAPNHIERSDFFTSFIETLKLQPEVKNLRAIEEAYVPVVKFTFENIELDMLFARLSFRNIHRHQSLRDVNILRNLDNRCVRSLNGCRVTDEILQLVPNKFTFRLALMAIKLWAKKREIYSNVLGYLGGISWTMLVAKICQLYPNAASSEIVYNFFLTFSEWPWTRPVLLKEPEDVDLGFEVWDPRVNVQDRFHLMPIITPSYPHQNSTYNVSLSTKTIIQEEIKRGHEITKEIIRGKAVWSKLFERPKFFNKYKHFLVLIASVARKEHQLIWNGLVESKIRFLITNLEKQPAIAVAHTNPNSFIPVHPETGKVQSMWFIGLRLTREKNVQMDLTSEIQSFISAAIYKAVNSNLYKQDMKIVTKHVRKRELNQYLPSRIIKHKKN